MCVWKCTLSQIYTYAKSKRWNLRPHLFWTSRFESALLLVADSTGTRGRGGAHGEPNNLGFVCEVEPSARLSRTGGHRRSSVGCELQVGRSCVLRRAEPVAALRTATQNVINDAVARQSSQVGEIAVRGSI